ncbi:tRNA (guanosine(37)-N1)-methyltransferase TrmD [Patescibacteria group bacterium]|nr:tRNA (guanosine(37)-N1)-methyltransferase TrmD [Patescibacteria group bacterium]
MKFNIITIFPEIFDSYFNESIIKRAQDKKKIKINIHNLRDYTKDKHRSVDDKPYGGGPGMVMMVEPIYKAIKKIKKGKAKVILFSPKGKTFDQKMANRYSKLDNLIMVCGRYEGVDERVKKFVDEEVSIGDYVLTGGEIPAMIVVDAVTRLIPGVIAIESLKEESFSLEKELKHAKYEYPQYTRPENFNNLKVPKVLLSGNHKKIKQWRLDKRI